MTLGVLYDPNCIVRPPAPILRSLRNGTCPARSVVQRRIQFSAISSDSPGAKTAASVTQAAKAKFATHNKAHLSRVP